MGALVAVVNKKQGDATEMAVTMLSALSSTNTEAFGIASSSCMKTERAIEALQKLSLNSNAIIGCNLSGVQHQDKHQPVMLKNASMVFEGRIYPQKEACQITPFTLDLRKHGEEAAKNFVERSFGDYAFVLAEDSRLIAGRDALGVCPLYYGENVEFAALASQRKALWKVGIDETHSFPPGHVAVIDQEGPRLERVKTLPYSEPKPIGMWDAAKKLEKLLQHSVEHRVSDLKNVAVAFSGGLDSSMIAFFAKRNGCNVHLIHVSLVNQMETEYAKKAAETLDLPIHIQLFKEEDVQKDLQRVLWLIEESDPVDVSIGIPIYWAAEQAAKMGFKAMLAGQGADELFGGYRRYVDDYSMGGEEEVEKKLFNDIVKIHENNLERDSKICSFHNVELRLPFVTYEIAEFAVTLPVNLKIDPQKDSMRKLVLRKAAESAGLPERIANKPKKAVQYTTGVDKALKKTARKQGVSVRTFLDKTFKRVFEEAA